MKTIKPSQLHLSFYIRKERKNHSGHPVYLNLSFAKERKVWNTGIRCSQHQWTRFKIGGDIPPELQHLFLEVTRIENTARAYFQAWLAGKDNGYKERTGDEKVCAFWSGTNFCNSMKFEQLELYDLPKTKENWIKPQYYKDHQLVPLVGKIRAMSLFRTRRLQHSAFVLNN